MSRLKLPRSLSLSAQLLLALVGFILGTTGALTLAAYRSSLENLEHDARRNAQVAASERAAAVGRLFKSRQLRAEGFLAAAESLCGEPRARGGFGWSADCVRTLMHEFIATEGALGASFTYAEVPFISVGARVDPYPPVLAGLAQAVVRDGEPRYIMEAIRGRARLVTQFDGRELEPLFLDRSGLGSAGEVFLVGPQGRFMTPARFSTGTMPPGAASIEPHQDCQRRPREVTAADYRGAIAIHALVPVPEISGGACVDAHIAFGEALAPAEQMRADLILRGAIFAFLGGVLALFAAQWIAGPVRRLAAAARALEEGKYRRPVPLAGPTEVQDLGRAFTLMADSLANLIAREQLARRQAEEANRAKDAFLATVSHELRTPLTAVMGWARLMRDGGLSGDSAARALAAIERNAEAQRRLIDDLLDVSRIVRGQLQFSPSVVSVHASIDAALEAVNLQAEQKQVTIERDIAPGPLFVMGDAQRLQQVMWNLVWNAVKFTPAGGKVRVSASREAEHVRLVVRDTGIGIAADFLPHVFDWFRQADSAPTRVYSGLGVGLGLVRQIVDLHGGHVEASSEGEGRGSTFVVTLPLHHSHVREAPHRLELPPARPFVDLHSVRVLVVDDDPENLDAVRALLTEAGATVETADNAAEARLEVGRFHPDVLISDLAMPREDGYSLVTSLRNADIHVPAIALTAYARREDAQRAMTAGFQVHIAKPVDPGSLVDIVATLAQNPEQTH